MQPAEALLSAEEYWQLPDDGQPTELVRGRIVPVNMPTPRHGYICNKVGRILGNFAEQHDLGRVMNNDSGVLTEQNPDTVRGADVAYFSYERVPRGPMPEGYLRVLPELVVEVRSQTDRWPTIVNKVAEYLRAGVGVVCVLDPQSVLAIVFYASEQPPRIFTAEDELLLPEVFGEQFRVPVRRFFE
ncbi:MAG TPA: Uma2 family endonuclease [Gemmataceae bacterium]|nr:Uma2 family endonuclease [Gemmataceae bacterium]